MASNQGLKGHHRGGKNPALANRKGGRPGKTQRSSKETNLVKEKQVRFSKTKKGKKKKTPPY